MLTEQTLAKLYDLKLLGMAETYQTQRTQVGIDGLSFDERFGFLVNAEHLHQTNRALHRRLKGAHLRCSHACIENLDYHHRTTLKRETINQLQDGIWIRHRHPVVITGPTGCGKTYLGCALANQACRQGYRALYQYAASLYRDLLAANIDGTLNAFLRKLRKIQLLVVDDFGLTSAQECQHRYFLELLDERAQIGSLVITSQYPLTKWHQIIPDATIADAIVDRLIHHAFRIELDSGSMRQFYGADGQTHTKGPKAACMDKPCNNSNKNGNNKNKEEKRERR